jgi:hypothetical protein
MSKIPVLLQLYKSGACTAMKWEWQQNISSFGNDESAPHSQTADETIPRTALTEN